MMPKSSVWCVSTVLLLTGCATVQKPVPVTVECPKVPLLELDAPARDYLGQMQLFLRGSLPTQPGLKPPSTPASAPTMR